MKALLLAWLALPAPAAEPLSLREAVRLALEASPERRGAEEGAALAALEEPLLLALTDPALVAEAGLLDDRSPRDAPAFQGSFTRARAGSLGFEQNWLTGASAALRFEAQRVENPALFRVLNPSVETALSLQFRQPLLKRFWGRPDKAKRGQARAGAAAARAALGRTEEELAASAARAYLELAYARDAAGTSRAALEDVRRLHRVYKEKKGYGLVEETDLLQAEASVRERELDLRRAELGERLAWEALRSRLGGGAEEPPALGSAELPGPEGGLEESRTRARASRGDLAEARARLERSSFTFRVETLEALPSLDLVAGYSVGGLDAAFGPSAKDSLGLKNRTLSGSLALRLPLFSRVERLKVEAALRGLRSEAAALEAAERRVELELRSARARLEEASGRLEGAEGLRELQRRKLEQGRADFERGRVDTDLLLRLMLDLRRAELELSRARADRDLARTESALAEGRLLEALGVAR